MDSNTSVDRSSLREKDIKAEAGTALPPLGMSSKEKGLSSRYLSGNKDEFAKSPDWESESDPENPQNWLKGKKVFHTLIPAFYGFVM